MQNLIDTAQLKQSINLIDYADRHVELRRATPNEYHGPCPWCGGHDRFRVRHDFFACRQCGKSGDAIEFVKQIENVDFKEAVTMLGGNVMPAAKNRVKSVVKAPVASGAEWNEEKHRISADKAHADLMAGTKKLSKLAAAYLEERSIDAETVKAFKVGYAAKSLPGAWDRDKRKHCQPLRVAISLPWHNHDGALLGIRYRFTENHEYTDVDGRERTAKQKSEYGSDFNSLFGWQCLQGPDKRPVLIITEGEMNALSLWQVGNQWTDVLSAGSESTMSNFPALVVDLAKQYKHVIVWADKGKIAKKAALSIGAASMQSPNDMDANDLLRAGVLGKLVIRMINKLGIDTEAKQEPTPQPQPAPAEPTPAPTPSLPPLPTNMWMAGFPTFAEARRYQKSIRRYRTACGRGEHGFYVAAPNSGMNAVSVPYTDVTERDEAPELLALEF